jgi:hypothetical protein
LLGTGDGEIEIAQQAIADRINPAVHFELLAACPGVLHDGRAADIGHLCLHVHLAEQIDFLVFGEIFKLAALDVIQILDEPQPIIDQTILLILNRGAHTPATVMTNHHDVFDLKHIDGVLNHRQTIKIRVHHHIRDVAMDEHFARHQPDDLIRRHAAVRTTDPQIFRLLLRRKLVEKMRFLLLDLRRPLPVISEEMSESFHKLPPD